MNDTKNLFSLVGNTAVVTGAAGYFGDSFCRALLDCGSNLILMGRGEKIKNKAEELKEEYTESIISYELVDFYDDEKFKSALENIVSNYSVDILVNNAYEFGELSIGSDVERQQTCRITEVIRGALQSWYRQLYS